MSSYPPSENYPPATQYSQQGYAGVDPYGQPQSGYGANPYNANPSNPYGQPQASYQPVNAAGQQFMYTYVPVQVNDPGRGQAIAGMILGIIGLCLFWYPVFGLPLGIIGLILSIVGRKSTTGRGMATAGIVLSTITLVLTVSVCGLFGALLFGSGIFGPFR
jgi:uncharacterized protein DUF4190